MFITSIFLYFYHKSLSPVFFYEYDVVMRANMFDKCMYAVTLLDSQSFPLLVFANSSPFSIIHDLEYYILFFIVRNWARVR